MRMGEVLSVYSTTRESRRIVHPRGVCGPESQQIRATDEVTRAILGRKSSLGAELELA